MKKKTRRQLFWICVILFLVISPVLLLYANGWRITPEGSIKRVGGIFVSAGTTGAEVFLDGELEKRTNLLQQGVFVQGLTPRTTSVIVAKEGYWPWTKDLDIKEQFVTEARAFLVPIDITGISVLQGTYSRIYRVFKNILLLEKKNGDAARYEFYSPEEGLLLPIASGQEYLSSSAAFETFIENGESLFLIFPAKTVKIAISSSNIHASLAPRPDRDATLPALAHNVITDSRGASRIWLDNAARTITADWLADSPLPYYFTDARIRVFESLASIRSIDYFPGRRDVILFAVQNNIFAIEIDGRSTRNFQPVYKGRTPSFARIDNTIYILDGNSIVKTTLR